MFQRNRIPRHVKCCLTFLYLFYYDAELKESLLCYQCADSKIHGKCQTDIDCMLEDFKNIEAMKTNNKSLTDRDVHLNYVKNCTGIPHMTSCIMERIEARGTVEAFIRDCSDGKTFSLYIDGLKNLKANNGTTCAYKGTGQLACVTLCDGDLCNGPQINKKTVNNYTTCSSKRTNRPATACDGDSTNGAQINEDRKFHKLLIVIPFVLNLNARILTMR